MKIIDKQPTWSREQIDAAIEHGWDQAEITVRDHLTQMIATTEKMVVLKDFDGRTTLVPYARILDIHPAVGVAA